MDIIIFNLNSDPQPLSSNGRHYFFMLTFYYCNIVLNIIGEISGNSKVLSTQGLWSSAGTRSQAFLRCRSAESGIDRRL